MNDSVAATLPHTRAPEGRSRLRQLWHSLPHGLRLALYRLLNWTGLPYFVGYVVRYRETHHPDCFAGALIPLRDEYRSPSLPNRAALDRHFARIMDALVLPNGVRKTTWSRRHNAVLEQVLADDACRLDHSTIRVLDLPASSGIASLGSLELLSDRYRVSRYVLGDLSFHVLYDPTRGCVFDENGRLLQVRARKTFFSIHRPHATGNDVRLLTRWLLLPLDFVSAYLKRRFPFEPSQAVPIPLVHPDIDTRLGDGMAVEVLNVFEPIGGPYDLILSFNLLQRNYFPQALIARAMDNLRHALTDGGLLIIGSPDGESSCAHRVYRRVGDRLVLIRANGDF